MPLQVVCPGCSAKLKAPDTAAGKKTKCPKCQAVISVPLDAPQAPTVSPGVKKPDNWYMQTTDGSQFGPVPRKELDDWFKEGRISAECQLLKEGADQWQWASEVYPSLDQSVSANTSAKASGGFDFLGPATSQSNDPLGLGSSTLGDASTGPAPLAPPSGIAPLASLPGSSAFGQPTSSFGGGFGGGGFAAAAPVNPYASPASAYTSSTYGGQPRAGLHPMAMIAAILEFVGGGFNLLSALIFGIFMLMALIGGVGMASNMPQNRDGGEAAGAFAVAMGLGMLCILPFLLLYLGLGTLKIYTGFGILNKRFWAKVVAIILAILYLLLYLLGFFASLVALFSNGFEPGPLVTMLIYIFGIAFNATILAAMFLPDCTSDFS